MPIQAIDTERLYQKIARQISVLIAAGELPAGQRLPAERTLAQQLGVSRPSVREALIALEIAGKVEIRVGSGVFVAHPAPLGTMPESEEGEGPFELIRARRMVEGETAACAAQEATEAELAAVRDAVDELRSLSPGRAMDGADRAFHLAVAAATHNGPLAGVVQLLWDGGRGAIWKQMEKHFQTAALRDATLHHHQAILEAIEARKPRAARQAMRAHLTHVDREFGRGWDQLKRDR